MNEKINRIVERSFLPALLVYTLIGMLLVGYLTRRGAGINGDGVWYVQGAENILHGYGYGNLVGDEFRPTTIFPPFYSITLAGLGIFGNSIFLIARYLNILLFGFTIFFCGWFSFHLTRSRFISHSGCLFALLSTGSIEIHSWVMTEPLFTFLTELSLVLIFFYLANNNRSYLIAAGFAVGFSVITRYVGIALIASFSLSILLFSKKDLKHRLVDSFIFGIICMLPTMAWFIRNKLLGLTLAGRSGVEIHIPPLQTQFAFISTAWTWIFPGITPSIRIQGLVILTILILLGIAPFWIYIKLRNNQASEGSFHQSGKFFIITSLTIVVYVATVYTSIVLALAGNLDNWEKTQVSRYLVPIFFLFVFWLCLGLYLWRSYLKDHAFLRHLPNVILILLLGVYVFHFLTLRWRFHYGYTEILNSRPELVQALNAIKPDQSIVTNDYEKIFFLSQRYVYSIPGLGDELTNKRNPDHPKLMQKIYDLIDEGAVVIILKSDPTEKFFYDPYLTTLRKLQDFGDVVFYMK